MTSRIPGVIIRTKPTDHDPIERAERFRKDIEGMPIEESVKVLQAYIDPDAPEYRGKVAVSQDGKTALLDWRSSVFAPTQPGEGETDAVLTTAQAARRLRRREQMGRGRFRNIRVRAPEGTFAHPLPVRRAPQTRVDALVRRYVAEWRSGNEAVLAGLLKEVCGEYWKMGTPITEDALRMLAARSLQEAEDRAKDRARRKVTAEPVK